MKKSLWSVFVLTGALLGTSLVSAADLKKCLINGLVTYTDEECPKGTAQPLKLPPLTEVPAAQREEAIKRANEQKQRAQTLDAARQTTKPATTPPTVTAPKAPEPKKSDDATAQETSEVSPEEGARQGAAGRRYKKENAVATPLPAPAAAPATTPAPVPVTPGAKTK